MSRLFIPVVRPEIFELRPDYCALSVVAEGIENVACDADTGGTTETIEALEPWPSWGDAHLEAWRAAYRGFGAKPQRTPSSAEALAGRLHSDGRLPRINAVVDLYNRLSVEFAIPIGGENLAAYVGNPVLKRATGHETFDTVKEGILCVEAVPAGEVVWADDRGVTCRRWNWRQGSRTRIERTTTRMWFVFERLEPMPMEALLNTGHLLSAGLLVLSPEAAITAVLIDRNGASSISEAAHSDQSWVASGEASA